MNTRDLYAQKYEAQLKEWTAKLDALHAEAQKATAQARIDIAPHITDARIKFGAARARLAKIAAATDDKWEAVKRDADDAWTEVKASVDHAFASFKNRDVKQDTRHP